MPSTESWSWTDLWLDVFLLQWIRVMRAIWALQPRRPMVEITAAARAREWPAWPPPPPTTSVSIVRDTTTTHNSSNSNRIAKSPEIRLPLGTPRLPPRGTVWPPGRTISSVLAWTLRRCSRYADLNIFWWKCRNFNTSYLPGFQIKKRVVTSWRPQGAELSLFCW